jgi:hypothetical protein
MRGISCRIHPAPTPKRPRPAPRARAPRARASHRPPARPIYRGMSGDWRQLGVLVQLEVHQYSELFLGVTDVTHEVISRVRGYLGGLNGL